MSKKVKKSKSELQKSLLNLKDVLGDNIGDGVDSAKSKASEIINDLLTNLHDKSDDYKEEIEQYVSENPLKSLGIVLGLGIIIGKCIL